MSLKAKLTTVWAGWSGIGFIRGMNDYKYQKNTYLYSDLIFTGLLGLIIYANPTSLPFMMYKEIYRLEVNLRNLEDEKKKDFYNKLF